MQKLSRYSPGMKAPSDAIMYMSGPQMPEGSITWPQCQGWS